MTMKPIQTLSLAAAATAATAAMAWTAADEVPMEFGAVHWGRQLEPALARSSASHKPVMLLFQEVPG
jgi:hypothetical protein